MTVDDTVASTDLQNPADALEFLAHVAERDSGANHLPPMHGYGRSQRPSTDISAINGSSRNNSTADINYSPLKKGLLSFEMIQTLLARYVGWEETDTKPYSIDKS